MKKLLAVFMIISIVVSAFVGCSHKKYEDKLVTVAVTDENGEEVTNENGEVVTEVIDVPADEETSEDAAATETTAPKDDATKASDSKVTTKKSEKTTAKSTTKKTQKTTEKTTEATTQKPKKRPVTVTVKYPYFNAKETQVVVAYKVKGDKEYTKLDPEDIVMNKEQEITYDLGKLKGRVSVIVNIKGVSVTPGTNKGVIEADKDSLVLDISTGIEVMNVFE